MEWTTYLFLVIISAVRGEFTSIFLVRNSSYDNKAFLASKLISTSHYRSVFDCAADCAKNHECKSTTFNADTHICQLLSAHKEAISNTTTKKTTGWVYFEKLITTYNAMPTTSTTTAVVTVSPSSFNCSQWHYFNGHWYFMDSTPRTFNDSRTFCASKSPSAYVIEVNSAAENIWLVNLTSTQCHAAKEYWLNAYDINNTKLFTWLESNTTAVYNNWVNGEPSHVAETCIVSNTMYGGEWADITCTYLRPVVCEKNS